MRKFLAETADLKTAFQPYGGHSPKVLLDRHPEGRLVALLVDNATAGLEQTGIWDAETGALVWTPDDAILLAWGEWGTQVFVLRRTYERDPNHPRILVSPLQSEFTHVLERRSWPERKLLGSCQIQFPTGWAFELAASPGRTLVTVTWLEQDCAGFVLVRWGTESGDFQMEGVGPHGDGYYVQPNLIQGPVFSPDGRYAVASCSLWSWWAPGGNPETPSPGGRIKAGHIAILDTNTMTFNARDVVTEVPAGWLPPDHGLGPEELMGYPEFTGPRTFRISVPTGEVEHFDLP